jgi:AcrR family transcriptional regulator
MKPRSPEAARLTRQDWIEFSLGMLAERGAGALRADVLARALNISRGSFYWHFHDVADLHAAVLDAWVEAGAGLLIAEVERAGGDAPARLRALLERGLTADARLERAVRAWAASDELAARALARADRKRLGYLADLFGRLGFAAPEAEDRAYLIYQAYVGYVAGGQRLPARRLARFIDSALAMLAPRDAR